EASLLVAVGAIAGLVGSLLGIGGGVLLVPALVLWFRVPVEHAVPASLLCVVASSCGAAASYVEQSLSDLRLALVLELATVSGAIMGGLVSGLISPAVIAMVFGLFALFVAAQLAFSEVPTVAFAPAREYAPRNYPLGVGGSFVAGGLSALLGVGGGPLK